jgi:all-trans-retinol 13,14-reductase
VATSGDITARGPWDVIVVGSGLGGLSAAAYLAAAGRRVLLLERYTTLGWSSHVCIEDRFAWLTVDRSGFDRIVGPGFELATPVGWDAYLANLLDAFPDQRRAVHRFHGVMRRIGEANGLVAEIRRGDRIADNSVLPPWDIAFDPFSTTRALHAT